MSSTQVGSVILKNASATTYIVKTTATVPLQRATTATVKAAAVTTLTLQTVLTQAQHGLAAILVTALSETEHEETLPMELQLQARTQHRLHNVNINVSATKAPNEGSTVTAAKVTSITMANTEVTARPTDNKGHAIVQRKHATGTVALEAGLLAKTHLNSVAHLQEALTMPHQTAALGRRGTSIVSQQAQIGMTDDVLGAATLLQNLTFVYRRIVGVDVSSLTQVRTRGTDVTQGRALHVTTQKRQYGIANLRGLSSLQPSFSNINSLLSKGTRPTALLRRRIAGTYDRRGPPGSQSSHTVSTSASSDTTDPSSSDEASHNLRPSNKPAAPFSSDVSVVHPTHT